MTTYIERVTRRGARMNSKHLIVLYFGLIAFSGNAWACRDAYRTHEARIQVSKVALVARVSSVSIPALERDGYDDVSGLPDAVFAPRTVRLVVTASLKGKAPRILKTVVGHCDGSLYADIGHSVYAYKIHGEWRLEPGPRFDAGPIDGA